MAKINSILTTIKGLSLTAKVGLGAGAVAIIVGGAAGIVATTNNADRTSETPQIVANGPNDDNLPSEPTNTELEEIGESKDDNNKTEQTATNTTKPTTSANNKPQATTQKHSSNVSTATNQSQSNNSASTSKPSTPATPSTQPSQPSTPTQPSQPTQPSKPSIPTTQLTQPTQPSEPEKKPDYNLNDNYIIAFCGSEIKGQSVSFRAIDKTSDAATSSCVAKIYSEARKHSEYANMTDEELGYELGGMGSAAPLSEEICSQYGLSCGRW